VLRTSYLSSVLLLGTLHGGPKLPVVGTCTPWAWANAMVKAFPLFSSFSVPLPPRCYIVTSTHWDAGCPSPLLLFSPLLSLLSPLQEQGKGDWAVRGGTRTLDSV
jgi:hypothetical protein